MGFEGKNSIDSVLKEEGLIYELVSESRGVKNYYDILAVRFALTEKGYEKIGRII